MMKASIITNGEIINYDFYKNKIEGYIVCADGGLEHSRQLNLKPDLIMGDFDSCTLNKEDFENSKVIKLNRRKDETDTFAAVLELVWRGFDDITIFAGIGSRFDHSFANIAALSYMMENKVRGRILNEHNEIFLIKEYTEIKGNVGDLLSILCLSETAAGVTTSGLEYGLKDAVLKFNIPIGISNVFTHEKAAIDIKEGKLIITKSF